MVSPKECRPKVNVIMFTKKIKGGDILYMSPKGYVYVAQCLMCICRLKLNVCMLPKV